MILVLVDHDRGAIDPLSLRAITAARKLTDQVEAIVVGKDGAQVAQEIAAYGAGRLHVATNEALTDYAPMASGRALQQIVQEIKPVAVLAAGSPRGNEQLAHLAAFLDLPMAAECSAITLGTNGSPHQVTRARWAGNLFEDALVHADLLIATVLAFSTEPEMVAGGTGTIEINEFEVNLQPSDTLIKVLRRASEADGHANETSGGVSLTDAKVIVSGGRGVGGPEGFGILEDLAGLLGGTVGCSRVVTSSGWRPHAEQVGQTGTKVAPDLYLACGISGAMQHIAGCKNSKTIVVINTDPEAPILAYADYAIIGDLHKVIPALTAAVQKARG